MKTIFRRGLCLLAVALAIKADAHAQDAVDPAVRQELEEGMQAWGAHDFDAAIAKFGAAIARKPPQQVLAQCYQIRGNVYRAHGDAGRALADFEEAIRLDPENARALDARGELLEAHGRHEKALADLEKAIHLLPDYARAYYHRGMVYESTGEIDKALSDYTEALRLDPNLPAAFSNRGRIYFKTGDYDRAIADFDESLRLDPTFPCHFFRGEAYLAKGDYEKALQDYMETLRLNPKDGFACGLIARLLAGCPKESVRDGKKAVEYGRKACELTEWKEPALVSALAAAYAETGDFDSAVKYEELFLAAIDHSKLSGKEISRLEESLNLYKAHKPFRIKPPGGEKRP